MRILVVGGGGREHALCWAIAGSPLCDKLYCAPGNAGIRQDAECVPISAEDVDGLVNFATENAIDLVVVGPEGPLVLGLVDRLEAFGWHTQRVDGNDLDAVVKAFDVARDHGEPKPRMIIADTLMGKGVPFLEAREKNHFIRVEAHEWKLALDALDAGRLG